MDPYEIEDTSDWLGSPTELETCCHFLRMYENEVQELTQQLRKARENIFNLVQMHADASAERDWLRTELNRAQAAASDARRRASDIETKSNWELMSKDKVISELHSKFHALTGKDPFTKISPR